MKRSEMIYEVIIDELANHSPISFENNNLEYAAKYLLKRIEEAGMIPPQIKKQDPGHFPGDEFFYTINEWEPEDE